MSAAPSTPENDANLSEIGRALLDSREGSKPSGAWVPPTAEELHQILPQYEIVKMLGRGGMGAVYMGRQTSLERPVAIKILSAQLEESDQGFTERFKNEAKAMAKLNHPGIVSVYDFGTTSGGLLYIVMEYVDGTDVAKMIAAKGRLHTEHAMAITAHVCDALAYAHERGIIHRDIKPANIMVGYDGMVKVADFGLAKVSTDGRTLGLTMSGMAMGTLHFMAPEALMLGTAVDHRADIYAVGVMLYQMLTGKLPQGMFKMPSLLVAGLDPRYDGIIAKGIMEDREARYQSAREMRADLDSILTQPVIKVETPAPLASAPAAVLPTQARPQRPGGRAPAHAAATSAQTLSHERRRGSLTWLWVTMLVLAVLGGVGWFIFGIPEQQAVVTPPPPASSTVEGAGIPEKIAVKASTTPTSTAATSPASAPASSSTTPAITESWQSLFNGKDLAGWQTNPANFPVTVTQGMILIRGVDDRKKAGDLFYVGTGRLENGVPQFKNFEVMTTLKTSKHGNSDLLIHAAPITRTTGLGSGGAGSAGIGIQIWNEQDPAGLKAVENDRHRTGSLWMISPMPTRFFDDDEWFNLKARVEDNRLQVWVQKEGAATWIQTADWIQPVNWTPPLSVREARLGSGTIAFSNWVPAEGEVWIKDIQLRVLNAPAQIAAVTSAANTPPASGPDTLEFTGADPVSGWSFISTRGARWPEVDAVGQGHAILESTDETLHPNNNMTAPRLLRDVTGDFTLETWFDFSGGGANKFAGSGLLLWHDDMNFIRLERIYADWQAPQHGISLQGRVNGVYKYWVNTDTFPTKVMHNRLRLVRKGGEITAFWLDSTQNWLEVGKVAVSWPAKIQAGIVTTALRGGPVVKTRFDRVVLTAATPASPVTPVTPATVGTPPVMATSAEEGFVPLFQNDSLTGWTGDLSSYQMRNGILSGGNGNLVAPKEYGDFSLKFDLRLAAGAYVEMSIRGQNPPQPNRGAPNASFGVVLRDNTEASAAALEPWKKHGAIYGYQEPLRMEGGSPGSWCEHEIRVENQHLTVTINGITVQDTDLRSLTRKAPGGRSLDLSRTLGQLAILGFQGTTEFRNMRIKELGAGATVATAPIASATLWIDNKGRSLPAKFVRIEGGNVMLDIAGKATPVALASLATDSLKIARQLQASQPAANPVPDWLVGQWHQTNDGKNFPIYLLEFKADHTATFAGGNLRTTGQWSFETEAVIITWANGSRYRIDVPSNAPAADLRGTIFNLDGKTGNNTSLRMQRVNENANVGWTSLFPTNSLTGWTGDTAAYRISNGVLTGTGRGDLISPKELGNFHLKFDLRISSEANSGLGIWREPATGATGSAVRGFEVQILDDTAPKFRTQESWQRHGGIYYFKEPLALAMNPVGSWNTHEIQVEGTQVKVTINGRLVQDADVTRLQPQTNRAPALNVSRRSGHLVLLGRNGIVEFRNMQIKELP